MPTRIASCSCGQLSLTVGFEGREEFVVVAVGAFAEPGFPAPTVSVYDNRKHTWVGMPAQIEHSA